MKTHKNLRDKLKVEIRVRDAFAIQKYLPQSRKNTLIRSLSGQKIQLKI